MRVNSLIDLYIYMCACACNATASRYRSFDLLNMSSAARAQLHVNVDG